MNEPLDAPPIGAARITPFPPFLQAIERARQADLIDLIRREVARTLYALLRSEEANVVEMSEEEFVAFCERVMSEGK